MGEKPFVYKIVDEKEAPDLAARLNENFAKARYQEYSDKKRIQVRKEIFDYYDGMTADQRAILLELHPEIRTQMSIEEVSVFISTGEIPERLLDDFTPKRRTKTSKIQKNLKKEIIKEIKEDFWLEEWKGE